MGKPIIEEKDHVIIKFSGDSGDGMQFTGSQFSETSAFMGNDVATFPDYPAEIRAPKGTVGGVSGFQLHIGKIDIETPGDYADVLVAMNPAALKANLKWIKKGGTIILDKDTFTKRNLQKAGCEENPLETDKLSDFYVIAAPITTLTKEALKDMGLDNATVLRSKNMFALGIAYWLFNRELKYTEQFLDKKFAKKPQIAEANKRALKAGYNYASSIELTRAYIIKRAHIEPGTYRHINGNTATAWGLLAAAEKAGLQLFLGSYPITPASEILQEIEARRDLGAIAFQAEDEIAGITTAIGAAFAGNLAATSTSGPGLALKTEAIGLAVMAELPIVIIDVQRAGPSTGMPTKPEQGDLLQALYGRNGESPVVVLAASSPANSFRYAYLAAKIALENMVPVILLTDGFIANGSKPWKIPSMDDLPPINPPFVDPEKDLPYEPYRRIEGTFIRKWAPAGTPGFEHRIGGLEKEDITGNVSYDPENHEKMVKIRAKKVEDLKYRTDIIQPLEIDGNKKGKLLVVGWGSTYGHIHTAINELRKEENLDISFTHFHFINPLPINTEEVLSGFEKILVCELNNGQFFHYLRSKFPQFNYLRYNKIQGLPFTVVELKDKIKKILEG